MQRLRRAIGSRQLQRLMKYDSKMDPQCVELCDALNCIPGIETVESCCGHGKFRFSVWFRVTDPSSLFIIGRITSRNYMPAPQWSCKVEVVDSDRKNPVRFHLSSGKTKGIKAYKQSSELAKEIYKYLTTNKWVCKEYGVKI